MRFIGKALENRTKGESIKSTDSVIDAFDGVKLSLRSRLELIVQKLLSGDSSVVAQLEMLALDKSGSVRPEKTYEEFERKLNEKHYESLSNNSISTGLVNKIFKSAGLGSSRPFYSIASLGSLEDYSYHATDDVVKKLVGIEKSKSTSSNLARHLAAGVLGRKTPEWLEVDLSNQIGAITKASSSRHTLIDVVEMKLLPSNATSAHLFMVLVKQDSRGKNSVRGQVLAKSNSRIEKSTIVHTRLTRTKENKSKFEFSMGNVSEKTFSVTAVCSFQKDKFVCSDVSIDAFKPRNFSDQNR